MPNVVDTVGDDEGDLRIPKRLSVAQERRLRDYIEEQFLTITGQFKKRSTTSTTLPTVESYLTATHSVLSLIMMIPPISHSASALRTTFLLRLTGDVLDSIPGYPFPAQHQQQLLQYLDDLDKAWVAVLQIQVWDVENAVGRDLILPADFPKDLQPLPVSQTDRTRLRSLLLLGTQRLEEWLPHLEDNEERVTIDTLSDRNKFNDMFHRTLIDMGELS